MNLEHKTEQMEAVRRDFEEVWKSTLWPKAEEFGARQADKPLWCHIAWKAFLAGINLNQK